MGQIASKLTQKRPARMQCNPQNPLQMRAIRNVQKCNPVAKRLQAPRHGARGGVYHTATVRVAGCLRRHRLPPLAWRGARPRHLRFERFEPAQDLARGGVSVLDRAAGRGLRAVAAGRGGVRHPATKGTKAVAGSAPRHGQRKESQLLRGEELNHQPLDVGESRLDVFEVFGEVLAIACDCARTCKRYAG